MYIIIVPFLSSRVCKNVLGFRWEFCFSTCVQVLVEPQVATTPTLNSTKLERSELQNQHS